MDPVTNNAKVRVNALYDDNDTAIELISGDGAKLPNPTSDGAFNLVWWNNTDHDDPTDDSEMEIVRCTARSVDTLTVIRAQEGTAASVKNVAGKVYRMILTPTKKTMTDILMSLPISYVIEKTGSIITARSGITGTKDYSGTNAETIIENAINALPSGGGRIFLKAGNYTGGSLTGVTGLILEGEGRSTVYTLAPATNATTFDVGGNNVMLRNLVIDGNKANQTNSGHVLNITGRNDIKLENCWLKNAKNWDCINIDNSNNVQIAGCEVQNADGFGTRVYNSYDVRIYGNRYHDNTKINITTDTSTGVRVTDNYSHNSAEDGLAFDFNSTYCVAIGNILHSNAHFGLSIDAVNSPYFGGNTISDNTIYNNGWEGANILRSSYNKIIGNTLRNNGQATHNTYTEIRLHQVTTGQPSMYNIVSGNTILIDAAIKAKYGIAEGNSEDNYNLVTGNIVTGAATANGNFYGANTKIKTNIGIVDN